MENSHRSKKEIDGMSATCSWRRKHKQKSAYQLGAYLACTKIPVALASFSFIFFLSFKT